MFNTKHREKLRKFQTTVDDQWKGTDRRNRMDDEGTLVTMSDGSAYTVTASGAWKKVREADNGRARKAR